MTDEEAIKWGVPKTESIVARLNMIAAVEAVWRDDLSCAAKRLSSLTQEIHNLNVASAAIRNAVIEEIARRADVLACTKRLDAYYADESSASALEKFGEEVRALKTNA